MKKISFGVILIVLVAAIVFPVNAAYVACYNGTDATIGVNWTFTGANGTMALVTNVGTPSNALLDFVIPAGNDGAPGAPGAPGINGTDGYTPIFGVDYFNGSQGIQGVQGIPGINGTNGINGINGTNGIDGINGTSATIAVNYTGTGAPGSSATVTNIGTSMAAILDFVIPRGDKGDKGDAGTNGTNGTNGINGTTPVFGVDYFNGSDGYTPVFGVDYFNGSQGLPGVNGTNGTNGTNGIAASITINYTSTLSAGSPATVTNIGNTSVANFNFGIPQGIQGVAGTNGTAGVNGTAATIAINSTVTGSPASVTNIGTVTAAIFDFVIPAGATGAPGVNGTNGTNGINGTTPVFGQDYFNGTDGAPGVNGTNGTNGTNATIAVNATLTGIAGSSAIVTNVGTPSAASFDFTIPRGYNGTDGSSADSSQFLFLNGTRAMTGNLSMGSNYINSVITGIGSDAVNRTYVDSGLPYISTTNASIILAGNTSFVAATNSSIVLTDNSSYLLTGGQREMTGNLSMGSYYINNLVTGNPGTSAVNRSYVDSGLPYVLVSNSSLILAGNTSFVAATNASLVLTENASYILAGGQRAFTGDQSHGGYKITNLVTGLTGDTAVNKTYVDSGLPYILASNQSILLAGNTSVVQANNASLLLTTNTSVATTTYVDNVNTSMKNYVDALGSPDLTPFLFINGTRAMTGSLNVSSNQIIKLVTGLTGDTATNKTYVDLTNSTMKSYVDAGLPYVAASNSSIIVAGNTSFVAATNTSLVLISNTSYWTGTNYNASYWTGTNYNASYWTGTNYNATYDAQGAPDLTPFLFINGTRAMTGNLNVSDNQLTKLVTGTTGDTATNKTYVDTVDATKAPAQIYGYVTLMSGSSMIPLTNPVGFDQAETSTNKNNYIYSTFSDGGSENAQWVVDMPGDWNSTDATNGKLTFNFLWTTAGGGGGQTVKFDIAGKLFPDDTVIDTALVSIGTATDTWTSSNNYMISPDTTAAVVTSAGTGGRTCIFKVTRDSATDTLNTNANLMGVRIKYIKTVTG